MRFGETRFGEMRFGETRFGETRFGKTRFGETEFGETGFGETKFCKTGFGGTGSGETGIGETRFGESVFGGTEFGETCILHVYVFRMCTDFICIRTFISIKYSVLCIYLHRNTYGLKKKIPCFRFPARAYFKHACLIFFPRSNC